MDLEDQVHLEQGFGKAIQDHEYLQHVYLDHKSKKDMEKNWKERRSGQRHRRQGSPAPTSAELRAL